MRERGTSGPISHTRTRWLTRRAARALQSPRVKRTVQVEIAGQQLSIRSDEGPEYVQELADYVDGLVRELTGGQRTVSPQRVALLVAVQIADELFREKDLNQRFRARIEARLRALDGALHDHEQLLEELG